MIQLLRFCWTVSSRATTALVALALTSAAAGLVVILLTGHAVGVLSDTGGSLQGNVVSNLILPVALLMAAFLVDAVCIVLMGLAASKLVYATDTEIYRGTATAMVDSVRADHLESAQLIDQGQRAQGIGNRAVWVGINPLGDLLRSRVALCGAAVIVAMSYSILAAVLLVVTSVSVEWWSTRMSANESRTQFRAAGAVRQTDYVYDLGMGGAAAELRLFGTREWLLSRFAADWSRAVRPVWGARAGGSVGTVLIYTVHVGAVAVGVWLLARYSGAGHLPVAVIATGVTALLQLATSVNGVGAASVERATSALAAYRAVRTSSFERASGTRVVPGWRDLKAAMPTIGEHERSNTAPPEIELRGVTFRYPGSDRDVLHDVNLRIAAGTAVGLVGVNGAGKSTLVEVVAGLRRPTRGTVLIDGVDLQAMTTHELAAWQHQIAPVAQHSLRLPLTAAQNLCLADAMDQRLVASAAAEADIAVAVANLPKGWETTLDRSFVDGGELSSGQWQRLALARARYALDNGARFLILDEPAAALDPLAESELISRYASMTEGVTSLLISHRFSVIRNAELIVVLEGGSVVEQGDHETLLARRDGRYASMFRKQASGFEARRHP